MDFDIKATVSDMLNAVKAVVSNEWPKVRDCTRRALEEERDFLQSLADARLAGEIDDDMLDAQLRDERETLEAVLAVCQLMGKKLAQEAANAAIDAFNKAVLTAAKSLIGRYTANVSSGTTLARADDRRPEAIQTAKTISSLSTKLAALTGR